MRPKDKLIMQMLQAFEALGCDHMARIDARICYRRFRRKARKLGVKI